MSKEPLVSVIVPTYNSASTLEACLASINQQSYKYIELIVVDNHSQDGSLKIAKRYADKTYTRGPERSAQRNYGVRKSSGEHLAIIDSDMVLTKDVIKKCVATINSNTNCKAVVIPEESFGVGFWAQCKKLERSFYIGIEWMEAARFFPARVFKEFNGYDEANTGTEDYDLPQRIQEKYDAGSIRRINEIIFHNEQRLSLIKTCKKKLYYSKELIQYKNREANKANYKLQVSPLRRYLLFFSQPKLLIKNPVIGAGMLFMKTCEFGSGALGYILKR